MINKNSRIYVAGHTGLVGSSVLRILKKKNFKKIFFKTHKKLDLLNQKLVFNYLKKIKPNAVIICAAKVGGIKANNEYFSDFIYENLTIQNNLIHGSYKAGVKNLIFLGSSCIYPKFSKQPIKEDYILSGNLETTNQFYAIAKLAGIKLCESYNLSYGTNYKCLMPCNIFGPNDNYNSYNSHFFSAILKKIYIAAINKYSQISFWGTGTPKRELIYVDDVAEACIFFLKKKTKSTIINIGSGYENTIKGYIKYIANRLNNKSKISFDNNKKINGTPRKLLNCNLAKKYGWKPKFEFKSAFELTLSDFLKNKDRYLRM
jgi:GDP-L-fucose synthase